jgi:type VI secretion system secreted protein VgrG
MAEQITQQERVLKVFTPLDFDVLLIESISGLEAISRPFRFTVKLLANVLTNMHQKVSADKLVGKPMSIELELPDGKTRYISGIVESFTKEGQDKQFAYYRAELVPWFWLLDLKADSRIFQDQSVLEVIQKIVEELGFKNYFRSDLTKQYTKWDYCVQYRETDFNFLTRLMEDEGISYYFEHKDDHTHTLVLTDSPDGHKDCPQQSSFRFDPEVGMGDWEDVIRGWETSQKLSSGKWVLRDYHFEMPRNTLEVPEASVHVTDENRNLDVFDYPGGYAKKFNKPDSRLGQVRPEGEKLVRLHMEQDEASHVVYDGNSFARAMTAGYKFTVTGAAQVPNGPYLLTSVQLNVVQSPTYVNNVPVESYKNDFVCIPASVPFLPPLTTPKPIVHGPQTARVIDESDSGSTEEIWPDKYGRVRVRFPWDREAKYACWIRVAHAWAGNMWGHQWIPRVGDEVVVTFLEGDPDCPLIVGSVYNADNMPPFKLPDNKTQSGILTHSSKQGTSSNYNMLRFEDKIGSEEIFVQAEKDLNTVVENDETRKVGNDRTTTIHVDDTETVETGNHALTVSEGNRTATISMGNDSLTVSLGNVTHSAQVGTYQVTADQVLVTGLTGITLTCGASTIQMTDATITIISGMINLNP